MSKIPKWWPPDDVVCDATGGKFDLQINPNGNKVNLLQTNPGTVMQGTAERVSRSDR